MNEKLVNTIDALLIFAGLCFAGATIEVSVGYQDIKAKATAEKTPTAQYALFPKVKRNPGKAIIEEAKVRNVWDGADITLDTYETEYIGRYFVTAYSHLETGSRQTASGISVHASDSNFEPTTCAIDPRLHHFGEFLMIDGKVYVTEDTGGDIKGPWVDCYVETMAEVNSWPTGYKAVYSVKYKTLNYPKNERRRNHEQLNYFIHCGSVGSWIYSGDGV